MLFFESIQIQAQYNDLHFQAITLQKGLSHNWVNKITRDHTGFIWIATMDGLNRYDGINVKQYLYSEKDSTSVSDNNISVVYTDRDNDVWVGTSNYGICLYNKELDSFIRFWNLGNSKIEQEGPREIRSFLQHSNGEIWIGTQNEGVWIYNKVEKSFRQIYKSESKLRNIVKSLVEDGQGRVWIGENENVLKVCDPKEGVISLIELPYPQNKRGIRYEKTLMFDSDSLLWIGMNGAGGCSYNLKTKKFSIIEGLSNNTIKDFLQIGDEIFIATDNGGINIFNKATGDIRVVSRNLYDKYSITSNGLYDLYLDNEGILWVATFDGGVSYYNPKNHKFNYYYPIPNDDLSLKHQNITSLYQFKNNEIYVGTDGGGLLLFDVEKQAFRSAAMGKDKSVAINNPHITSVFGDSNYLYVAAFQRGVAKVDLASGEIVEFNKKGMPSLLLSDNSIVKMTKDKDGNVWFVSSNGYLNRYEEKKGRIKIYSPENSKPNTYLNRYSNIIFQDLENRLWCGNLDGYISKYNAQGDYFEAFSMQDESFSGRRYGVNSIVQDEEGVFWVGTHGGGLKRFDEKTESIRSFTIEDGLPSNNILDVLPDSIGRLWISTTNGLCSFDIKSKKILCFNQKDGLQGKQFSKTASLRAFDETFYFGGVNGLNSFNPYDIKKDTVCGSLVFTQFEILNKAVNPQKGGLLQSHISHTKEVTLSHLDYVFSIEFLLLNYTNPEKVAYLYMMEGFDNEWIETNNAGRKVTYTNLPGGEYLFKVMAYNHDGIKSPQLLELKVKIIPPLYKRSWFRILSVFIVLLGVWVFFRYRTRLLERNNIKLEQEVKNRTLKIQQQNNELEVHRKHLGRLVEERTKDLEIAKEKAENADRLKSAFLANMSHEIRTPMNAIVGFSTILNTSELTEKERSDFLKIIGGSSESLLRLIDDIIDISKIEAGQMDMYDEEFDVVDFMNSLYLEYSARLENSENKDLQLLYNYPDQKVVIKMDKTRMRQVMVNLLDNAFKFTEEGSIAISLEQNNGLVNVSVKDTGIGIRKDLHEFIFDRFTKVEYKQKLYSGTGLGLFITKRIVEFYGGKIGLVSEENRGAKFWFALPVSN